MKEAGGAFGGYLPNKQNISVLFAIVLFVSHTKIKILNNHASNTL